MGSWRFYCAVLMTAVLGWCEPGSSAETRVVILVGPSTHPPGSHEVAAGGKLMQHCLQNTTNVSGIQADLIQEWPLDDGDLERASTIVFIGDIFPPQRLPETERILARLESLMQRGCGIACIHYATGLRGSGRGGRWFPPAAALDGWLLCDGLRASPLHRQNLSRRHYDSRLTGTSRVAWLARIHGG